MYGPSENFSTNEEKKILIKKAEGEFQKMAKKEMENVYSKKDINSMAHIIEDEICAKSWFTFYGNKGTAYPRYPFILPNKSNIKQCQLETLKNLN